MNLFWAFLFSAGTLVPPVWIGVHIFRARRIPLALRVLLALVLLVVSQMFAIDRTLFKHMGGPDMPAWLLECQAILFFALILTFLVVFVRDIARSLSRLVRRPDVASGPMNASRRAFLKGVLSCAALPTASVAISAEAVREGTAAPVLHETTAWMPSLPAQLEGLRIAHLTDIHIGPLTSLEWAQELVALVNKSCPDIICITGDITDGMPDYQCPGGQDRRGVMAAFAGLSAPMGVFGCIGNHDVYTAPTFWLAEYERCGIQMLRDEGRILSKGGASLALVGINDPAASRAGLSPGNLRKALQGMPGHADGAVRVLLDHRPGRAWENASEELDLQLSGHTHGGHVPGMDRLVASANKGLANGWYRVKGLPVYVSSGIGLWSGFPIRLGIPAEVALLTLRRGEDAAVHSLS